MGERLRPAAAHSLRSHVCRPRRIFPEAHVPGKNAFIFFASADANSARQTPLQSSMGVGANCVRPQTLDDQWSPLPQNVGNGLDRSAVFVRTRLSSLTISLLFEKGEKRCQREENYGGLPKAAQLCTPTAPHTPQGALQRFRHRITTHP